MLEFLARLFKRESSGATAKERLRLVLLSDHLSLAPDVVEALRNDLIGVISKYVEVDETHCDVTFERQDDAIAMLANIPILSMKQPPRAPRREEPVAVATPEPAVEPSPEPVPVAETSAAVATSPTASPSTGTTKRKRRRAANQTTQPAT